MHTVIVKYALPAPVPKDIILEAFEESEGVFRSAPGLIRKYFCYDEPTHTGHSVYVWESEAHARAFHTEKFARKIHEVFAAEPEWVVVETLMVVDNSDLPTAAAAE